MMHMHKKMMRLHKIILFGWLLAAGSAARAQSYSADEAAQTAEELARQLGMPDDKRITVGVRFRDVLTSERFRAKYAGMQLRGVFAYQMGEGGLIVKVKKGRGLLRWKGSAHELHLELKSVTVGAQIGGSSEWGLAVIASAKDVTRGFGGDYSGGTVAASMGGAGTTMMELTNTGGYA